MNDDLNIPSTAYGSYLSSQMRQSGYFEQYLTDNVKTAAAQKAANARVPAPAASAPVPSVAPAAAALR
jgi:hypothetical protein